jgi:Family of unknown function (DUF6058)
MSDLDHYLSRHYLNADQFAEHCGIGTRELFQLIDEQCIPAAAYVVTEQASIQSYVFGEMPAPDSTPGQYFHPANHVWVALAKSAQFNGNAAALRQRFTARFETALSELNRDLFHLEDSFTPEGTVITEGLNLRTDSAWQHFLKGTFGLCIANPISEAAIARKEILQEKLSALSENGSKTHYSQAEKPILLALIDEYAAASMPFSPIEYPRSSRKRLVDDLKTRI